MKKCFVSLKELMLNCLCRISELERKLEEDRVEAEERLKAQRMEYENKLGELEVELVKKKKEVRRMEGGGKGRGKGGKERGTVSINFIATMYICTYCYKCFTIICTTGRDGCNRREGRPVRKSLLNIYLLPLHTVNI